MMKYIKNFNLNFTFSIIVLFSILLYCCSTDNNLKIGLYRIERPTKLQMFYYKITSGTENFVVGSELILKNDSTYEYSTCGNLTSGKWFVKNDLLFLVEKTNRWRNDSLNLNGWDGQWPDISKEPIIIKINGNYLENINYDSGRLIELLKFVYKPN